MERRGSLGSQAAFVVLAIVPGGVFVFAALRQPAPLAHGMFHDDAYYYFGIARNLAAGRGSTFNGIDRTNGYHPGWMAVLTVTALLVRGKESFLVAVAVVEALIWTAVIGQIQRVGSTLRRPVAALVAATAVTGVAAESVRLSFNGMESVLVVLVLLSLARVWIAEPDDHPANVRFGVLIALLVLCRLDAVFVAVSLLTVRLWWSRSNLRALWRRAVMEAGPTLIAVGVYLAVNWVYFASPVPVSGRAKSLGAPFWGSAAVRTFLGVGSDNQGPRWLGLLGLGATLGAAMAIRRSTELRATWQGTMAFVASVWTGTGVWILWLTVSAPGAPGPWYLTALVILLPFPLAVLADVAGRQSAFLTRTVGGSALALVGLVIVGLLRGPGRNASIHDVFVERAVANGSALRRLAGRNGVVAMGDRAGALSYESDLTFVQLEGLVESVPYLTALGRGEIRPFMAAHHVSLYLRSGGTLPRRASVGGQPALRFAEPFQGQPRRTQITVLEADRLATLDAGPETVSVFKYRPELNR